MSGQGEQHMLRPVVREPGHWDESNRDGIMSGKLGAQRDETRKADLGCIRRPSAEEFGPYHESGRKV